MIEFLEIGKYYKLETKGENETSFYYTAKIIAKTETAVKLLTIRNETVILHDTEITKCTETTGEW